MRRQEIKREAGKIKSSFAPPAKDSQGETSARASGLRFAYVLARKAGEFFGHFGREINSVNPVSAQTSYDLGDFAYLAHFRLRPVRFNVDEILMLDAHRGVITVIRH